MRKVAALKYELTDPAPKVVGIGQGAIADKIIAIAQEKDIPIIKSPYLAQELTALNLGDEIPPELYQGVAEVLAFIYRLSSNIPDQDK